MNCTSGLVSIVKACNGYGHSVFFSAFDTINEQRLSCKNGFNASHDSLRPGMSCRSKIFCRQRTEQLLYQVPSSSLEYFIIESIF